MMYFSKTQLPPRAEWSCSELFALISRHTTVRTLLALTAAEDLELHQLIIKTAFLKDELKEITFVNSQKAIKREQHS